MNKISIHSWVIFSWVKGLMRKRTKISLFKGKRILEEIKKNMWLYTSNKMNHTVVRNFALFTLIFKQCIAIPMQTSLTVPLAYPHHLFFFFWSVICLIFAFIDLCVCVCGGDYKCCSYREYSPRINDNTALKYEWMEKNSKYSVVWLECMSK